MFHPHCFPSISRWTVTPIPTFFPILLYQAKFKFPGNSLSLIFRWFTSWEVSSFQFSPVQENCWSRQPRLSSTMERKRVRTWEVLICFVGSWEWKLKSWTMEVIKKQYKKTPKIPLKTMQPKAHHRILEFPLFQNLRPHVVTASQLPCLVLFG